MNDRAEILGLFGANHHSVAVYLARQGHYREPKLLEVQYRRCERYLQRLNDQCPGHIGIWDVYVEFNAPRSHDISAEGFPRFSQLLDDANEKRFTAVLGDTATYDARLTPFHWVKQTLNKVGVAYLDAGLDAGGFVAADAAERFGAKPPYSPTDAEDVLAFFPGLADRVIYEFLNEVERRGGEKVREALETYRRNLSEDKPYRIATRPLYWTNKADRLWREQENR